MNRYVFRTSLVWIAILALAGGIWLYRSDLANRSKVNTASDSAELQPVAAGPSTGTAISQNAQASEQGIDAPLVPIQLSPERMQSIGVQVGTAEYKELSDTIRATGTVDIDERSISYVQVRFPGYIRQVFANATYQYVRKGEPLFSVYSPDLVATQKEYLLARQNEKALSGSPIDGVASGAESLAAAAEQRLEQWGVAPGELEKLKETGKPVTDLIVPSPASGYVIERNALPNMYVEPSTRLYTLADLSSVWVYAQIFQDDISRIRPGERAEITADSYPGRIFAGRIDEILPQVNMATRTVRVRIEMANPGLSLKPGMFVNVDVTAGLGRQLVVPASAVIQSGTRQLVFLNHGNGNLEPKEITAGMRVGDDLVVTSGLAPHASVVTSANFLIDSESQLQAAAGSFVPPPPGVGSNTAPGNTPNAAQVTIDLTTEPDPPQKGTNILRVRIKGGEGAPIIGAQVTVLLSMPAMPTMGMAAMNANVAFEDRGNGLYEGSVSFDSGGTWQATILVRKGGQLLATNQVRLNVTGGM